MTTAAFDAFPDRLTVAISTLDRHAQLATTLEALAATDLSDVEEVIVVDQSERAFDPETLPKPFPVPLRVVHQRARGLGVSRNEALRQTATEIVLFIDDDVLPEPDLTHEHLATYREYPAAVGVAGYESLPHVPRGLKQRLRSAAIVLFGSWMRWHGFYRGFLAEDGRPVAIVTRTGLVLCDFARTKPCRVMTPRGCNMSWRRDAVLEVGGFDPGWVGPRRDETDVALRVLRARPGSEIRFNPRARLVHLMHPSGGCRSERDREWYASLLRCELRFARRNLAGAGLALCRLRLLLQHGLALLRHPSLLRAFVSDDA